MIKEEDVIQHIKEEDDDYYSDDDIFKIASWGADLSFREIIDRYEEDDLIKPELQRKYVWDKTEASRFIDSILLGLPIPSIFLAKTHDERMLIVDGYQRIMTARDYVKGIFSRDQKIFKLSRSEKINKRWRGKAFGELSDSEQRKIKNTTIHAIIFVQQHPEGDDTSMYQVFERINTSGRTLTSQEIRNCVYQGEFNTLLFKLNKNNKWRELYGLREEDPRMRDMEFILRFFALKSPKFKQVKTERISLKRFLNIFMGAEHSKKPEVLKGREESFNKCIDFIYDKFGKVAFHNFSEKGFIKKFSPTIFDSTMIATHIALKKKPNIIIHEPLISKVKLLKDEAYQKVISKETMTKDAINKRIDMVLKTVYGLDHE